jgi:hypothetical protein
VKSWSTHTWIRAGVGALVVLAGIGVVVWLAGFRESNKSALPTPTASSNTRAGVSGGFPTPTESTQSLIAPSTLPSTTIGGVEFGGSNIVPLASVIEPGSVALSQPSGNVGESLNYTMPNQNSTVPEQGGVQQFTPSELVPTDSLISPGDLMFSQANLSPQGSLSNTLPAPSASLPATFNTNGVGMVASGPMISTDSLISPGDIMMSQADLEPGGSFTFNLASGNAAPGFTSGGIEQLSTSKLEKVPVSPGDVVGSQMFETTDALSTSGPTANGAQPLSSAGSLNTAMVTPGELLYSQLYQTQEPLSTQGAQGNTLKPLGNVRTTQSSNTANAARIGIVYCGALVNHRCAPQYTSTAPHTAKQLLVGFLWSGMPTGTKVQLFFIDVARRKVIGTPTKVFPLPAGQGGAILAGFKGPFPTGFQLGTGVIVNGKQLSGAAVIRFT